MLDDREFLKLLLEAEEPVLSEDDVKNIRYNFIDNLNSAYSTFNKKVNGKTIKTKLQFSPGSDDRIKVDGNKGQFSIIISKGTEGETVGSKVKNILNGVVGATDKLPSASLGGSSSAQW